MSMITLERNELLYLLKEVEADALVGMDKDFLTLTADVEAPDDITFADETSLAIVGVIANPQAVVCAVRTIPNQPAQKVWFYATGSAYISLTSPKAGQYQLAQLLDESIILDEVEKMFPLEALPDTLRFKLNVDREDIGRSG